MLIIISKAFNMFLCCVYLCPAHIGLHTFAFLHVCVSVHALLSLKANICESSVDFLLKERHPTSWSIFLTVKS